MEEAGEKAPPLLACVKGREQSTQPVIIQPYRSDLWCTAKRLRRCDIYALPDDDRFLDEGWLYDVFWWMQMFRRDVTLWPVDVWSSHVFTTFIQHAKREWSQRERSTITALRWAWGHPLAEEIGEPAATIETLWRFKHRDEQRAA